MKTVILALVFAAGLSAPSLAQQAPAGDDDHTAHHPQSAQEQTAPAGGAQPSTGNTAVQQGRMPGRQGDMRNQNGQRSGGMMSGMGPGMMECPMMQGNMRDQGGQPQRGSMSGMRQGMMNCPMMNSPTMGQNSPRSGGAMSGMENGMMNGPMDSAMRNGRMPDAPAQGSSDGMQMGKPRGDQSVPSIALNAINERMHRDMATEYTGKVDVDFVRGMIAHHQGAIDMAKIAVAFGQDSEIRDLAQNVIKAQEGEITMMKAWLAKSTKQ